MKAAEIMTKNVVTIRSSVTVAEAIKLMKDKGLRTLIIDRLYEEDAYGIVTETDVVQKVAAFGKNPKKMRVYEIMTKPCIVVNPDLAVEYVARLFTNTGICSAPVIQGKLLGIISMSDILTKGNFAEQPQEALLEAKIQEYIEKAHTVCAEKGVASQECVTTWKIVEDLQAEAAYQQAQKLEKTAFEEYSENYPEVLEAREYDAWCSG